MKFETRFKELRLLGGYSQQQVASTLGCSVSAYSKYENGEREPSIKALIGLADFYHISLDSLLNHKVNADDDFCDGSDMDDFSGTDDMAALKKTFNFELAEKTGDGITIKTVDRLGEYYDCLTVKDIFHEIDFLLSITATDVKDMVDIFGVSRSGYYHWRKYGDIVRKRNESIANEILKYEIPALNSAGYDAVTAYLRQLPSRPDLQNISVARVKRIMDSFEIIPEDLRDRKNQLLQNAIGKYSAQNLPIANNELSRRFSYLVSPCQFWCIDISEIKIEEGKLYLCAVMDLCGRLIVGYSFGSRMSNRLVQSALESARLFAKKYDKLPENAILIHSDRGMQFRSGNHIQYLSENNMRPSMSKAYCPNDNACIESFFASLKCEYLYRFNLPSTDIARKLANRYITFYNTVRVHQTIMDVPIDYWIRGGERVPF